MVAHNGQKNKKFNASLKTYNVIDQKKNLQRQFILKIKISS